MNLTYNNQLYFNCECFGESIKFQNLIQGRVLGLFYGLKIDGEKA